MPAKEKYYCSKIVVQGSGYFPFDMLRYDSCVPVSPEDLDKILALEKDDRKQREVSLWMYYPIANMSNPTFNRWASFGWKVVEVAGKKVA